jgi:hypothetical protein
MAHSNSSPSTGLTARCRSKSGTMMQLAVTDIGPAGCLVDRRTFTARPGDRILIRLQDLGFQPAKVVWVEGEQAAIAFENLLHDAVLSHLQQSISNGQAT